MANYNPGGFSHICRCKNSLRHHWCKGHFVPINRSIPYHCRAAFTAVMHPCDGHPQHSDSEIFTMAMSYQSQRQNFLLEDKEIKDKQRNCRHEVQLVVPMEVPMPPPMPEEVANRNSAQQQVQYQFPVAIRDQRRERRSPVECRRSPRPLVPSRARQYDRVPQSAPRRQESRSVPSRYNEAKAEQTKRSRATAAAKAAVVPKIAVPKKAGSTPKGF